VFRESIQFEYPLSDVTREELQRFQRILELNDAEIAAIEAIIIQSSSEVEYRKQQEKIRQQPPIQQSSSEFKYIPFKFETVTVDKKGQVVKRDPNKEAKFFKEDLGNGITLGRVIN
jgi:hypothetical protein